LVVHTEFARSWFIDPEEPDLKHYLTALDSTGSVPQLETSLQDIGEYHRRLWANRKRAVLLVIHGPDTSGKDSLVRTLATYIDPAGFRACSFGRPTETEAGHDFLWRVTPHLPAYGQVVTFNRSHHEAVISERIWPVREPGSYDWNARYRAIREFEQHLVRAATLVVKIWLNLSEDEHRQRLLKRLDKPRKRWKFDDSDIEGWKQRGRFLANAGQALAATHTEQAPWLIVPGDRKPEARAIVAALLADWLKQLAPEYPQEHPDVLEEYRRLLAEQGVG